MTAPATATRDVGILWENAALAYLCRAGMQPLERNYNCRYGEIDLIMLDKSRLDKSRLDKSRLDKSGRDSIVFVEVRYRNAGAHGDGVASVGQAKRAKLVRAAALYLQAHPQLTGTPCRFDVIACAGTPESPSFDWIRAAFDAC